MPKVLITNKIQDCGLQLFEEAGFEVVISPSPAVEDVKPLIGDCDAVLARMTPVKAELIEAAPKLKIIGMHGVGLDAIDVKLASEKGIAVTYAPAANGRSVAELVMAFVLDLSRKVIPADYALRSQGRFKDRDKFVGHDIEGKTIGIVGMGRIGQTIAKMASCGFDMQVLGYDPFVSAKAMEAIGAKKAESVEEVLKKSDFVSLNCAPTPDMIGFMDYEHFKMMKPSSFFINCARGSLVNYADLCRALEEGVIAGAATDVFEKEPVPENDPVLKAPDLIATPHIAASTKESMDRVVMTVANDFIRYFKGERPEFLANPQVWEKVQ